MFRFRSAALLLAVFAGGTWAAPPSPLPAGWILFDSNRCTTPVGGICKQPKNFEIYAQDPLGNVQAITNSAVHDSWWPKLSPDRTKVLFHRTDAGLKENDSFKRTSLWWVPVDGSAAPARLIAAAMGNESVASHPYSWLAHAHAEWSPLQNAIVLLALESGAPSLQIYVAPFNNATNAVSTPYRVSAATGGIMRPGQNIDPSFTLDGAGVLFVGCANEDGAADQCDTGNPQQLILTANVPSTSYLGDVPLTSTPLGTYDFDPYYNTDGGQIGWLYSINCNRWGIRHGTYTGTPMTPSAVVIDDGAVNSKPSWMSANTLFFHRWPTIASTVWFVNASTWAGGLLEPAAPLASTCRTDGITQATASWSVSPDPSGLSTATLLFASTRCGHPVACDKPTNWRIYRWTLGSGVNPSPLPIGADSNSDYYEAKVSPNRSWILFMRSPHGENGSPHSQSLWVMNSSGGGVTQLIASGDSGNAFNWKTLGSANWSADGTKIVLSAANATQLANNSPQIYRGNFTATPTPSVSSAVKLSYGSGSGDRPGKNVTPSYSPDGAKVVFSGCALNAGRTACLATRLSEIVTTPSTGGSSGEVVLTSTTDSTEFRSPIYSPSGAQIAAVHTLTCTSTELVKLNSSTGALVGPTLPGALHFGPQWSYDGSTIFFGALPNNFRSINWRINANVPGSGTPGDDGTGLSQVTGGTPCSSEYPNAGH